MGIEKRKTIYLAYYAQLREKAGIASETIETMAMTARELYDEIHERYGIVLPEDHSRVSINDVFSSWQAELKTGDRIAFIPPVSGG